MARIPDLMGVVYDHRPDGLHVAKIPEVPSDAHEALLDWLRFHDIDPHRVPRGSRIDRVPSACLVAYTEYVFGDDGRPELVDDTNVMDVEIRDCKSQGEAPPLPLPPEVEALMRPLPTPTTEAKEAER